MKKIRKQLRLVSEATWFQIEDYLKHDDRAVLPVGSTEQQWEGYGVAGQAALVERIATRRLGTPEDIACAVLIFASRAADWISGQQIARLTMIAIRYPA